MRPFTPILVLTATVQGVFLFLPVGSRHEPLNIWISLRTVLDHFNPGYFTHPSLYFDLVGLSYGILYGVGRFFAGWDGPEELIHLVARSAWAPLILARMVSTAGVLSAAVGACALARHLWGNTMGLWAGALVAINPLIVEYGPQAHVDALAAGFGPWIVLAAVKWRETSTIGRVLAGGCLLGLSVSANYSMSLIGIVWLYVVAAAPGLDAETRLKHGLALALAAVGSFLAGTPHAILSPHGFWHDVGWQFGLGLDPTRESTASRYPFWFYAARLGTFTGGYLPGWLAPIGLACVLREGDARRLAVGVAAISYLVAVSTVFKARYARYLLPIMPLLMVLAAVGLQWTVDRLRRVPRLPAGLRRAWPVAVFLAPAACVLFQYLARPMGPTPAEETAQWLRENVEPGAKVLVDSNAVVLTAQRLEMHFRRSDRLESLATRYASKYGQDMEPFTIERPKCTRWQHLFCSGEDIHGAGFEYAVMSTRSPESEARLWLEKNAERVATFSEASGSCFARAYGRLLLGADPPKTEIYRLGRAG